MHAIKQKVTVQNGVIALPSAGLEDGTEVEVVVLSESEFEDEAEMEWLVQRYDKAKAEWEASGEAGRPASEVFAEIEAEQSVGSESAMASVS